MKLNKSRTTLVGFAFFSITIFWALYNNLIPLILKLTYDLNELVAGIIMASDNILALFLLPFFGMLSDRTNTKLGKRMPYIVVGTLISATMMLLLVRFDNPNKLAQFIIVLGFMLIGMSIYRSPAVALMPDITPKPLLSKGNAVINLMGTIGGLSTLIFIKLLSPKEGGNNYFLFGTIASIMVICIFILLAFVRENRWREEKEKNYSAVQETTSEKPNTTVKISTAKKKSLLLLLASVFLWYFGYNSIESAFSKYAVIRWGLTEGKYSIPLMVASISAIISYIPLGMLATKIGRKKSVLIGISSLAISFICLGFSKEYYPVLLIFFILAGVGIAAINVNSYPMVIAIGKGDDVGKYTGYYYAASMASQIFTPVASGALLQYIGYWTLFPYAALFIVLSFVTMIFVKHGDTKPEKLKNKLEAFDIDD
ncbi:MAG: MFS transporter [Eubacteriales bacterium]